MELMETNERQNKSNGTIGVGVKKLISQFVSFLSYHNAVPIAVSVLFVGGASAFAATATGVLPLPNVPAIIAPSAPEKVDVSALLSSNLAVFDFRPTVLSVSETDDAYTVSYSIQTLAPQGSACPHTNATCIGVGAWGPYEKTGEFSVAKATLGETSLQGYVVQKLQDIENGERSYLTRAQDAERELAMRQQAQPANAFASLVGLALNQIPVPIVAKPAPTPQQETPPVQNTEPRMMEVPVAVASVDIATSTLDATSDATTTTATTSAALSSQAATSTTATSTESQSAASGTSNANSSSDATTSSAESTEAGSSQQTDQQNPMPDTTAASTTPTD